ncbi:c-type cytochrome [Duganella sp. FT80W]|uniref:C-type cytochrome n=1 Tax=Duganella guangzhouensis TaxID=2666084 RepID=A0A6I2KU81_9BURK|nr:cytochrome c [Duganella guangzhouensis]MRW89231.1 c-type cytochrome [Duganella guangzhouensis]
MNKRSLIYTLALLGCCAGPLPASAAPDGAALFQQTCAACHGADGTGIPGLAPPLANPELWSTLGPQAPRYLAQVMTGGLSGTITSAGVTYSALVMPPQSQISAADLALISGYVLGTLNGGKLYPSQAEIEDARAQPLPRSELRQWRNGKKP